MMPVLFVQLPVGSGIAMNTCLNRAKLVQIPLGRRLEFMIDRVINIKDLDFPSASIEYESTDNGCFEVKQRTHEVAILELQIDE